MYKLLVVISVLAVDYIFYKYFQYKEKQKREYKQKEMDKTAEYFKQSIDSIQKLQLVGTGQEESDTSVQLEKALQNIYLPSDVRIRLK